MSNNKPIKVLTRPALIRLARRANTLNLNRRLKVSALLRLPEDRLFPISMTALHNDDHFRCTIVMNEEGETVQLDMTMDDYNKLPTVTLP